LVVTDSGHDQPASSLPDGSVQLGRKNPLFSGKARIIANTVGRHPRIGQAYLSHMENGVAAAQINPVNSTAISKMRKGSNAQEALLSSRNSQEHTERVGSLSGALLATGRDKPKFGTLLPGFGVFGIGCALAALSPGYCWFAAALAVIGVAALTFYVLELTGFPGTKFDDLIDSTTQA
jgi:hypothetical protein